MDTLLLDLRHGVRALRRSRGVALLALLCLALGLGANAALFGVVNGVLLRPLPYAAPERLVRVFETAPRDPDALRSVALPTVVDWNRELRALAPVATYSPWTFDVTGGDRPEQLDGASVSASLFPVLGVRPALGRAFTAEEEQAGGPRAVVLGDALWRRRFGGDRAVLGRVVTLNGERFTVVGVMPPGFAFPTGAELWASVAVDHEIDARDARHVSAIARLAPGATLETARAELLGVEGRLAERFPRNYTDYGVRLIPLHERIVGDVRPALLVLFGAVTLVLLIACANVANLLLARATARRREMGVRTALGASRARLVRQLVTESLVLSAAGGALAVVVAAALLWALRALGPADLPRLAEATVDGRVLAFTFAVAAATGVLFGLAPALAASRADPHAAIQEDGKGTTAGAAKQRLRGALVVTELALALVLLVGAGLLIRTLRVLTAVDPGVRVEHVLTFHVGLPPARHDDRAGVVEFYRRLRERLGAAPGAATVGLASRLPLSGDDHSARVRLPNEPDAPGSGRSVQDRAVSPGYFAALGIPVRAGREFAEGDGAGAPPVVIVNEALARRLWPGERPAAALGRQIIPSRAGKVPREIVGVVGDAHQFGVDAPADPEFYLPHAQDPWPWLYVVVRTRGDPRALVRDAERAVWSLDPNVPVTQVRTMEALLAESLARRRFQMLALGAFAGVAMLLAVVGVYGVMAYLVARRTREIGIRVALGAGRGGVLRLVVGEGARLAALGVGLGLVASLGASRAVARLLYGVSPTDPLTFAGTAALLGGVALVACWVPARRAARVDPVRALRDG